MNGELAELLDAAEVDGVRNLEEILRMDAFVDANKENVPRRAASCTVWWRGGRALKCHRS